MPPLITKDHDHTQCISNALDSAREVCIHRDLKLTPVRRQVLELIWQGHEPSSAYDILERLAQKQQRKIAPPTVYRALEFLLEHGFIHRLESLNAYIGCNQPTKSHQSCFLICTDCQSVTELREDALYTALGRELGSQGFQADSFMIEVKGRCADCLKKADAP